MAPDHIVEVGGCANGAANLRQNSVHADAAFQSKVPLVALPFLVQLRVALAVFKAGRSDEGGFHRRADLEQ
jgi:hypothetical protein